MVNSLSNNPDCFKFSAIILYMFVSFVFILNKINNGSEEQGDVEEKACVFIVDKTLDKGIWL